MCSVEFCYFFLNFPRVVGEVGPWKYEQELARVSINSYQDVKIYY